MQHSLGIVESQVLTEVESESWLESEESSELV